MAQTLCLCRSLILFRRVESGAGLILIAGRDGKLSATLAKNAWRSGRNISLTVVRIRSPVNVFLLASRPVGATIRRSYIFSHSKWSSNLANYVGQSHHRQPMLAERMAVHFFRLPSHHSRSVRCSQVIRGSQVSGVVLCHYRVCASGLCCRVRRCSCGACGKQAEECNDSQVKSALLQQWCAFDCFHAPNLRRTIKSPLSRVRQIFQCHSGAAPHSLIRDSCKRQ